MENWVEADDFFDTWCPSDKSKRKEFLRDMIGLIDNSYGKIPDWLQEEYDRTN